jgi:hypothetical protein
MVWYHQGGPPATPHGYRNQHTPPGPIGPERIDAPSLRWHQAQVGGSGAALSPPLAPNGPTDSKETHWCVLEAGRRLPSGDAKALSATLLWSLAVPRPRRARLFVHGSTESMEFHRSRWEGIGFAPILGAWGCIASRGEPVERHGQRAYAALRAKTIQWSS